MSRYRDRWCVKQEDLKLKKQNGIRRKWLDDFWYTVSFDIPGMCYNSVYSVPF